MEELRHKQEETLKQAITSCRWMMAYMTSLCLAVMFALRVNLGLAIICMVKHVEPHIISNNSAFTRELETHSPSSQGTEGMGTNSSSNQQQQELLGGDIEWDNKLQGWILSSLSYGYVLTGILGGYLAGRFGGKRVILVAMVINGIMTLCIPAAARFDGKNYQLSAFLVIVLRFIIGAATGVVTPAVQSIIGRWAPKYESSKLTVFSMAGIATGTVVMLSTSGFMCKWDSFDGGWPSIFYIGGVVCLAFCLLWTYVVYDSPEEHPRITDHEKELILNNIDKTKTGRNLDVPWRAIMTSRAIWAIIVAQTCDEFGLYTELTKLPAYMNDVLKFDIQSNGIFSTLPNIAGVIVAIGASHIADLIRKRHVLTTGKVRKLSMIIAFFVPAMCFVAIGHMTSEQKYEGVALLVIGIGLNGFSQTGYVVNYQDIMAKYAGEIYGFANTFSTLTGMIAPLLVSMLTPNGTIEEWRIVFYVWAAVYIFGAVFYTIFGDGETQKWVVDHADI